MWGETMQELTTRESVSTLDHEQTTFIETHNPGWVELDWIIKCINRLISTIDDIDTRRKLENMRTEILKR